MEVNPYAPPTELIVSDQLVSLDRLLEVPDVSRSEYIVHESKIKTIGLVYLITAPLLLSAVVIGFCTEYREFLNQAYTPLWGMITLISLFFIIQAYAGYSLWRLRYRGKPLATVVICIGMVGFPLITMLSIYCAHVLRSKMTKIIFSPEYLRVISATPRYKLKPPVFFLVSVFLVILWYSLIAIL